MAVWSKLPKDVLERIAKHHVETDVDFLRFRSVCSTWRSSVATIPNPSPSRFPILPGESISDTTWGFHLWKRTIFLLGLPEPHHQTPPGWLIKIEQDLHNRTRLLNPFSRSQFRPLPETFLRNLDLLKFRVSELGHEYILQEVNYRPFANPFGDMGNLYMEKVAVRSGSGIDNHVVLATHDSRKLSVFKFAEGKWAIIDDMPSPYDDVMSFDGQFYAVDITGRTVIVDVSSSPVVNLVADSVFGGDKKHLVESCGELLLVDTYQRVGPEDDLGFDDDDEGSRIYKIFDCYLNERTVGF